MTDRPEYLLGIYEFTRRSDDELDINRGDYIEVIEDDSEFGDSWYIGRNVVTGQTGLFPKVFTTTVVGLPPSLQNKAQSGQLPEAPEATASRISSLAPGGVAPQAHMPLKLDTSTPGLAAAGQPRDPGTTAASREGTPVRSASLTATMSDIDAALSEIAAASAPSMDRIGFWTPYDVRAYFLSRGYDDQTADRFVEHRITGTILLELDLAHLKEIDISSFGSRFEISKDIKLLNHHVTKTRQQLPVPGSPVYGGPRSPAISGPKLQPESRAPGTPAFLGPRPDAVPPRSPRNRDSGQFRPMSTSTTGTDDYFRPGAANQSQRSEPTNNHPSQNQRSEPTNDHTNQSQSLLPKIYSQPEKAGSDAGITSSGPKIKSEQELRTPELSSKRWSVAGTREANNKLGASVFPKSPPVTDDTRGKRSLLWQPSNSSTPTSSSAHTGTDTPRSNMSEDVNSVYKNGKHSRSVSDLSFLASSPSGAAGTRKSSERGHHRRHSSMLSVLSGSAMSPKSQPNTTPKAQTKRTGTFKNLRSASSQYLRPALVKQKTSAFTEGIKAVTAESAARSAEHSGWLHKRGGIGVGSWKARFFTLHGTRLSYFTNFKDTKERGLIDITGHRVIVAKDNEDKLISLYAAGVGAGKYCFKIIPPGPGYKKGVTFTAPKIHYFAVESQNEMREWMAALTKATIERDESVPAVSSCTTPTISLPKAQGVVAERLAHGFSESDTASNEAPQQTREPPKRASAVFE